jgi:hypothetical protein
LSTLTSKKANSRGGVKTSSEDNRNTCFSISNY